MSMGPWESYRAGTWLIDECQIAFFMSCLMLRVCTHLFCRYFQCHLSYHQQFVWYPGYHGYQFCAPLLLWLDMLTRIKLFEGKSNNSSFLFFSVSVGLVRNLTDEKSFSQKFLAK